MRNPDIIVRRSKGPYVGGLIVCLVFLALPVLEATVGFGADVLLKWWWLAFEAVFVFPVTLLMAYSLVIDDTVVAVDGDRLVIHNCTFPWLSTTLRFSEIEAVTADWWKGTSRERVVFTVSEERFQQRDPWLLWARRWDSQLGLDVLNATTTADEAANSLQKHVGLADIQANRSVTRDEAV